MLSVARAKVAEQAHQACIGEPLEARGDQSVLRGGRPRPVCHWRSGIRPAVAGEHHSSAQAAREARVPKPAKVGRGESGRPSGASKTCMPGRWSSPRPPSSSSCNAMTSSMLSSPLLLSRVAVEAAKRTSLAGQHRMARGRASRCIGTCALQVEGGAAVRGATHKAWKTPRRVTGPETIACAGTYIHMLGAADGQRLLGRTSADVLPSGPRPARVDGIGGAAAIDWAGLPHRFGRGPLACLTGSLCRTRAVH